MEFIINGLDWAVFFVEPNDYRLFMGNRFTLGVTDLQNRVVYLSNALYGEKLYDVLWHELTHCWLYSHGYQIDIPCEELICQVVERDSDNIQFLADSIYRNIY